MRRLAFCFLLCFSWPLQAQDFTLQQVSHLFPSAGFEEDIQFWQLMFTRYGETQVVFHDRRDLRLVYEVVHFDRGIADDPDEAERQRDVLDEHKDKLKQQLQGLADGVSEAEYSEEQAGMVRMLLRLGYEPDARLYRELSEQLRFQRGIKEQFQEGIVRSGRYQEYIEEVFAEHGLPRELAVLPHIESSFRHEVQSKAGAVGLWQFVRGTGRLYMTVNASIDERFDPLESTRAAARLLQSNFQELGSWPLAITAYNHGLSGMKRAKRQHGSDMLKIARNHQSRLFGFASRNFYPEFLAALEVYRNREHYFGALEPEPRVQFETFRVPRVSRVTELTKAEGVELEALKVLNPALRPRVWRSGIVPAGYSLRVPQGTADGVAAIIHAAEPAAGTSIRVADDGTTLYRVRRGDNLAAISARFGVSIQSLARANAISNRNLIHPGQVLAIPTSNSPEPTRYKVRRGDTLLGIALRFGRSLQSLIDANNLRNANHIFLGQVLLIP